MKKAPIVCLALILCDDVIEDVRTHKKSFLNSFNSIIVPTIPTNHPQFCVVCSITDAQKANLAISIKKDDTQKKIMEVRGQVSIENPLDVVDIVFTFRQIPLNEIGSYSVEITSEGEYIASRRFTVQAMQSKEKGNSWICRREPARYDSNDKSIFFLL